MKSTAAFQQSELLAKAGFTHAFFSRTGGVSSGNYATLNLSTSVGDSHVNVTENLRRAAAVLGVAAGRVCSLSQVHGNHAVWLDGSEAPAEVAHRTGDALA